MKITALVENISSRDGIGAEHGLSLFIETMDKRILFDMGQTELFAENAEKLGIDISTVDFAVLSHGHYDHGGGINRFFRQNPYTHIYISPYVFEAHYNGEDKHIGIDTSHIDDPRCIDIRKPYTPCDGVTIYPANYLTCNHEPVPSGLTVYENEEFRPDDFCHEQFLMIEENGKKVLFSGCSHNGILNIADTFAPDVLIGGFHFSKLPCDDTLASYAEYLDRSDTTYYTCHCTGTEQYEFMKKHMKNLHYLAAGETIEL